MVDYNSVLLFVNENIYHSKVWDNSTETLRKKAINQAERTLKRLLPTIYTADSSIPVEHIAEQTLWTMKIDDTFQRAELGATSLSVDGVSISVKDKDRTICPFILEVNGITPDSLTGGLPRRKVGRYGTGISDNFRIDSCYKTAESYYRKD